MILSRRAALNAIQLDQQDDSIVIRGTDPGKPNETLQSETKMGGSGQRPTFQHFDTLDATVTYAIDIYKRNLSDRREVFDKVNAWALKKGWLTMNCMDGKRLYVDKVIVPGSGDLWNWTADFTITFRAYSVPFWQDATATTKAIVLADEGSGTITVPGTADTVCNAEIVNAGNSEIDTMSVKTGTSQMSFSSLGLAAGETLEIKHGNNGLMTVRIKNTSNVYRNARSKWTGGNADDLYVSPGSRQITITGGDVTATVSCFGRYV